MGTDSCFKCGQPGHFAKECPQIVSGSGSGAGQIGQRQFSASRGQVQSQRGVSDRGPTTFTRSGGPAGRGQPSRGQIGRPQTQARVFAVTQQEADVAPEVMTGTIQVFESDAYVLIDSGATHSFIFTKFIAQVNIEIQPIDCSMVVSLPTGDSLIADRVYRGCRVIIEGYEFMANLVLLYIVTPQLGIGCQVRGHFFFFLKLITFTLAHSYNVKQLTCIIFCSSELQNIYIQAP